MGAAYRVLVSELMLQQTQVATVVPYFERFMAAFPTLEALAAADEGEVLALWQGLGYYRRARHLHAAARAVVERHGGEFPRDVAGLRKLPGVGRYTAGAIASIAFGQSAAVVDGNVKRVLARLLGIDGAVDAPATERALWSAAERLVPSGRARTQRPGDFNQALMELGALVCTPRDAKCGACPLAARCVARASGRVDALPVKGRRAVVTRVRHVVVAVYRETRRGERAYFLERRPESGLWAGMWQMPTWEGPGDEAQQGRGQGGEGGGDAVAAWVRERYGWEVRGLRAVDRFEHLTTHRRIAFELWTAAVACGDKAVPRKRLERAGEAALSVRDEAIRIIAHRRWVELADEAALAGLAMSNPQRRCVKVLRGGRR